MANAMSVSGIRAATPTSPWRSVGVRRTDARQTSFFRCGCDQSTEHLLTQLQGTAPAGEPAIEPGRNAAACAVRHASAVSAS